MLPLARELIKQGTAVVIAANSLPSINDVTAEELRAIVKQAGQLDKLLDRSLQEGTLQVVESGSDLPVIDLSKVAKIEPSNYFCCCLSGKVILGKAQTKLGGACCYANPFNSWCMVLISSLYTSITKKWCSASTK